MKKKRATKNRNKKISKTKRNIKRNTNGEVAKVTKLPVKKRGEKGLKEEGILNKIDKFFKEAKAEILKVKWPSQKELIVGTIAVIIISLVFAFFLGIVDIGIIKILKLIIR